MKKTRIFIAALAALCYSALPAQQITYYLPRTQVCIDITYEITTCVHGPFYQYSERYLGTKDVVTQDKTVCRLLSANIGTTSVADYQHAYSFIPGTAGLNSFCLSREGMLRSINAKETEPKKTNRPDASSAAEAGSVMPLSEEVLLTGSIAKMAEGTAKQIYRLREARLNILSGDVDKMPADAGSMKQVLSEIEKQEQQLTSLFIGTKKTEKRHKRIILSDTSLFEEPAQSAEDDEHVAFRFSTVNGPVDAADLSGVPYYLTISDIYRPAKPTADKKASALSPIVYCVPGSATFTISDEKEPVSTNTLLLSSLGYTTALPADYIKTAPVLHFDRRTGALISAQ